MFYVTWICAIFFVCIYLDSKAPLFALVLTFGYLPGTAQEVFESYADELGTPSVPGRWWLWRGRQTVLWFGCEFFWVCWRLVARAALLGYGTCKRWDLMSRLVPSRFRWKVVESEEGGTQWEEVKALKHVFKAESGRLPLLPGHKLVSFASGFTMDPKAMWSWSWIQLGRS